MPILGHSNLPFLCVQARVEISHHLTRDALVFNVGVAVRETPPLFSNLLRSHFDFPRALNEFL
jgi:hypothetical protein